jgi:hypothetical protein
MPIITHKVTGKSTSLTVEQVAKLRASGKIHAYTVEKDTPPQIPKEIKKLSADKQKAAEFDTHGTSTIIDGTPDGNIGTTE